MMPNLRGLQKSVFALKTGPRAKEGHVEQKKGWGSEFNFPPFSKESGKYSPDLFFKEV